MRLGFTVFFKEKPPKGNYSKPSEATNKFNTIIMKKVCYPHGQTCASRRFILKELIHSPYPHTIIPDGSEYRQKSNVPDPQP